MSDRRVDELEVRYSLLEKTVQELSEVLWRQQQELDAMKELLQRLQGRLEAGPGLVDASAVERPPHY